MKRTTKATKRYTSVLAVTLCASVAAFATPGFTTVYENDFSTRTSLAPVPASCWSTTTYKPDTTLYYNFTRTYNDGTSYRGGHLKILACAGWLAEGV